jgi:PLP dependent protein
MAIQENLKELLKYIPAGCTLIAVSKTQPLEKIKEAYDCGQRVFGENRAQEMAAKYDALPKDIAWHMIGHLQTNKVKYIAPFVGLIHSVDSLKLLEEINRQATKVSRVIPCLLQVHIAAEETKFGFSPEEVLEVFTKGTWKDLKNVQITGLMGMATFTDDGEQIRREFRTLKKLFDEVRALVPGAVKDLSMGMSNDYRIALDEGSTMVRVGTAIFGSRVQG